MPISWHLAPGHAAYCTHLARGRWPPGQVFRPSGTYLTYSVQPPGGDPYDIAAGPDGNLWFTLRSGNRIASITPTGTVSSFSVPTTNSSPSGITAGPDGNVWFTESAGNKIGRITPY